MMVGIKNGEVSRKNKLSLFLSEEVKVELNLY